MWVRDWIELLRLARRRFRSDEDYRRLQGYQATLIARYLVEQGIQLGGQRILDLGCGDGGYGEVFRAAGAEVIGVDRQYPARCPNTFVLADAQTLPFAPDSFSLVFCASLIEHVPRPRDLLREIRRVVQPAGVAYLIPVAR